MVESKQLAPESEHVMRFPDRFYGAQPFYQAVRELAQKAPVWLSQLEGPTAAERLTYYMARVFYDHGYWGGGSISTPPDDVIEALEQLFGEAVDDDD